MKGFNKSEASTESEKLIVELIDNLEKTTTKFLNKHKNEKNSLIVMVLQTVAINYVTRMTNSIASHLDEKIMQLDYLNVVNDNITATIENIKTKIKSVSLN